MNRRRRWCGRGNSATTRTRCGARRAFMVTALAALVLTLTNLFTGNRFVDGGLLWIFKAQRGRGPYPEGGWQQDSTVDYPCPYMIHTREEALARGWNTSIPGNVVTLQHLRFGRAGNRFRIAYQSLLLGYCCKSKLVVLPPKDDIVAPGIFNQGTPGPRWFDFSNAPDVKGFDSSTCTVDVTWGGEDAFQMEELSTPGHPLYVPKLKECIEQAPRLLGCEAVYYFPQDVDICHAPEEEAKEETSSRNGSRGGELEEGVEQAVEKEGRKSGAGNLVMHIRSGDVFEYSTLTAHYGQPPLQFYTYVMRNQAWDRIDVVTYADHPNSFNPVVAALQAKSDKGEIMDNFHIHTNRTFGEDLRSMMCADGLALAQSTLKSLAGFHSSAVWVFGALGCKRTLRQLAESRRNTMVYGVSKLKGYSVFGIWENTPEQRNEMLTYNKLRGLKRCRVHYW